MSSSEEEEEDICSSNDEEESFSDPPARVVVTVHEATSYSDARTTKKKGKDTAEASASVKGVLKRLVSEVRNQRGPLGFTHADLIPFLIPAISVDEVGIVPLPLTDFHATQLKKVAHLAPFGKGTKTVVDTSVRHTYEIKPNKVTFVNQQFSIEIQKVVDRMAKTLHVEGPVHAELHRLLMYEKDSKFLPHRDTEKRPGMFGTLVVALPCADVPEGGDLVVSHGNENQVFTCSAMPSGFECFGFFCNCLHEIKPLRNGRRLTLVFNVMANPSSVRLPSEAEISISQQTQRDLESLLITKNVVHPPYFALVLEHSYSPQSLEALGSAALKGSDAAIATALSRLTCVDFAVGTLDVEGWSEGDDFHSYKRRRSKASFEDMAEVSAITLSGIRPIQGDIAKVAAKVSKKMHLNADSFLISLKRALMDASLDVTGGEFTGNEGENYEYHYSTSAMIIWTNESVQTALTSLGSDAFVSYLQEKLQHWRDHRDDLAAKNDCYQLIKVGQQRLRASFLSKVPVAQGIADLKATDLLEQYLKTAPLDSVAEALPAFFATFEKEQVATLVWPKLLETSPFSTRRGPLCCALLRCYNNPQQERRALECFANVLLRELGIEDQDGELPYNPSADPETLLEAALTHLTWSKLTPAIQAGLALMQRQAAQKKADANSYYSSYSSRERQEETNNRFLLKLIRSVPPRECTWLSKALRPWLSEWFDFSLDILSKFEDWYGKALASTMMVESFTKMISSRRFDYGKEEEMAQPFLDLVKLGYASEELFKQIVRKTMEGYGAASVLVHTYLEELGGNASASSTFASAIVAHTVKIRTPLEGFHLLLDMLQRMIRNEQSKTGKCSEAAFKILVPAAETLLNRHSAAIGTQQKPADWSINVQNLANIPSDIQQFIRDPNQQGAEFRYTQKRRDREPVVRALRGLYHSDLSVEEVQLSGEKPFGIRLTKHHSRYNHYLEKRQEISQHVKTLQEFRAKLGMDSVVADSLSMAPSSNSAGASRSL